MHLLKQLKTGSPIASALDGYPIYGPQTRAEAKNSKLDLLNGHQNDDGRYHYHSTFMYSYLNGGFRGEVRQEGGQVEPQPRIQPLRPADKPLRGAVITRFKRSADGKKAILYYQYNGTERSVGYTASDFNTYRFHYNNGPEGTTTQTYQLPRNQRPNRSR